ncbi:hypothetical protein G4L39_07025 [Limisphaera ngatamarikiensis]|uniref:Endonuclease/exonuclease/phosphatase domain-containing protein n=1 Tax=Limisphaera ngatamarikiensis TaxID=1324935 RepID=A0A6M1RNL7_9BACT|nr:hypothetical protein [Limisphaera ngatamarikiensis]NGO39149.1 hypothetical protein [Limisphaera ngatamarikiensis]
MDGRRKGSWYGGWTGVCWLRLALAVLGAYGWTGWAGEVWPYLAVWSFNSEPPDGRATTGRWEPVSGWGVVRLVGGMTGDFGSGAGSSDPAVADNSALVIRNGPAQGTGNKQHGLELELNPFGWRPVALLLDVRAEEGASRYWRVQFRAGTGSWTDGSVLELRSGLWVWCVRVDLPAWAEGAESLGIRIVSEFEASARGRGAAAYVAAGDRSAYDPAGGLWVDHVRVVGQPVLERVRAVTWNLSGFGVTNWGVEHPQLMAAARVLRALDPVVVGFEEVPEGRESEMTNWVRSWWPGATVAVGTRTDGALRLAVASRLPVGGVRSWLRRASLSPWGYEGVFTRELLEAEIWVPGCAEPMHLFVVHLKAGGDADSAARRAAEALAISNFFATTWPARSRGRAMMLAGDCNEDLARPRAGEQGAVRILAGSPPGLTVLTPVNPVTRDERTWSIRDSVLRYRFDYLLVGGWLVTNLVESGVFRSDVAGAGAVQPEDSRTASDHLPVWAGFANPGAIPRSVLARDTSGTWRLSWWMAQGVRYRVESSVDLGEWLLVTEGVAVRPGYWTIAVGGGGGPRFFRVLRLE